MSLSRRSRARLVALTTVIAVAGSALPASAVGGVDTARAAMLDAILAGASVDPLITVGDTLTGGYRFESIPDGISLQAKADGVHLWVNHETSTVPFPYPLDGVAHTEGNSQNDFDNSQVSKLVLDGAGLVVSGEMVIGSDENFQRFCSNYLGTAAEGFERPLLFTNEEGVDWINDTGTAWPATIGGPGTRQIGVVVAHDVASGETRRIWGMGRHNHENAVPIPGYNQVVVLSGDDTFTTAPSQSQLYSYIAADGDAVWNDKGGLWAFQSTTPGYNAYDDFDPLAAPVSIQGKYIRVPNLIATGLRADGSDIMSSDPEVIALLGGSYPPPADGTWQRRPGAPATEAGMDGPQWVLEKWSQLNNVFRFIRLEDIAYDKRPGMSNVVYIVDSGRGTAGTPQKGRSTNGRIWKMVLDPKNPKKVNSLSILIEGDDNPVKTSGEIHQPDNVEATANGLYITEDPGSSQQFDFTAAQLADPRRTEARIFQYQFAPGAGVQNPRPIFKVNQSQDEEAGYDLDAAGRARLGAWEASGIVDASEAFGEGAFLVTVQAHSLFIEKEATATFTKKREGGQLLLIRVPGG